MKKLYAVAVLAALSSGAHAQGQVNIICSVQADWCNMMSTVYTRASSGEVTKIEPSSVSKVYSNRLPR